MAEQNKSQTENKTNLSGQSTGISSNAGTSGSAASARTAREKTSEGASTLGAVSDKVKSLYQQAADTQVGQVAKDALGQVKDNATVAIDEKKADIAHGLTSVAGTIRQVGDSVKPETPGQSTNKVAELTTQYTDSLAAQVEKLSGYLENQDLRAMARDLESFARRNPLVFIGGAFALGFLAARFLKSSNPNQALARRTKNNFGDGFETNRNLSGGESYEKDKSENQPDNSMKTGAGNSFDRSKNSGRDEADNIRQFNSSTTGNPTTTSNTGVGSTGTGTTGIDAGFEKGGTGSPTSGTTGTSSTANPTPSNKTGGDFGSSKF